MTDHIAFSAERHALLLLDQRFLPDREEYFVCRNTADTIYALQTMPCGPTSYFSRQTGEEATYKAKPGPRQGSPAGAIPALTWIFFAVWPKGVSPMSDIQKEGV